MSEILPSQLSNCLCLLLSSGIRDRASSGERKDAVSFLVTSLFPHAFPSAVLYVRNSKRGCGSWKSPRG